KRHGGRSLHGLARKERKTQPRDSFATRYTAALSEAVASDIVVATDVHNMAAMPSAATLSIWRGCRCLSRTSHHNC
ncbi:MAG TPA: hypothetical protein VFF81_00045, partial [Noviherbaspirillum sp.]|nr:hypothetical protein [Noviherbaspirillum sp.]